MVAIGVTDLLFAMDSIPAIFGLTQNVFIVFSATAFSLLGLRQLFFLLDGLLERLLYLGYGLAVILAFIGVKLILHALHENNLPFVNDGAPVRVAEISTSASLAVIIVILLVTIVASLRSPKGKAMAAVTMLRRHVADYLGVRDSAERARIYGRMVAAERRVRALDPQFKALIREPAKLEEQLAQARRQHATDRSG
jgi:tellurite resistance protein TerC